MSAIRASPAAPPTQPTFEQAAAAVMADLRASLADLVGRIRTPVRRTVDLERGLELDKKLAWQVFRLVQSSGLAEIEQVPPPSSIRRLLSAAKKRRIPESAIRRVREAFDRFEEFARLHGGDRAGLMSIVSGGAHGGLEQFELKVRKSVFRGNAHLYGVQAHTLVRTFLYNGVRTPRPIADLIMVQADIGMQRLRESQPLSVACCLKTSNSPPSEGDSTPTGTWRPQPGATADTQPGPEFLTEFCTQPLPEMIPRHSGLGGIESELVFPTSGRTGAVTLYSSIFMEDTREGESGTFFGKTLVVIPAETIVIEMLIPTGWTDPATARLGVYARRDLPEHVYDMRRTDLLPQRETLAYLGAMEGIPAIDGAPDHPRAIRHALTEHGWLGTRFDVYRCHLQYPILHSMLFYAVDAQR